MQRPRHPLSYQIACLNEAIGSAREGTREGLEDARDTLERVKDKRHILNMLSDLQTHNPDLFAALYSLTNAFPGARIVHVREEEAIGL